MKPIIDVFLRECRLILGRKGFLMLILPWPILYALLMGMTYSEKVVVKMPVAVADNDHSSLSRTLTRYIGACRSFDIAYRVDSEAALRDLIYAKKIIAGIYIPRGLERTVKSGQSEVVTAYINGTNLVMANLSLADLKACVGTVSAGIRIKYLRKTGSAADRAMALQSPVKTGLTKLYNPAYSYLNYLAPGIWMAIIHQVMMLLGALMIAQELDKKTFTGLLLASRGRVSAMIAGKTAVYLALGVFFQTVCFMVLAPLFAIPVRGSLPLILFLSLLFCSAAVALGFLFSAAMRTRSNAIKSALLLSAPAFILSGYTWPVSSMPALIKPVAWIIPLTPFLAAFRKVVQEGAGISFVYPEIGILALMCAGYFAAGAFFLKRIVREGSHGG